MKYFVIVLFILFCNCCLISQVDETTTAISATPKFEKPNLIIKWSPSPLVSLTAPTLQFSVEYPIGRKTKHFYLEHDAGYVYADPATYEPTTGFRFGTRIKYYFKPVDTTSDHFYLSMMARYSRRIEKQTAFFERAGGAYRQQFDYKQINNYTNGFLEIGYMGIFGKTRRIIGETFIGLGALRHNNSFLGIPDDAEEIDDTSIFNLREDEVLPSMIWVFKFGYILK